MRVTTGRVELTVRHEKEEFEYEQVEYVPASVADRLLDAVTSARSLLFRLGGSNHDPEFTLLGDAIEAATK